MELLGGKPLGWWARQLAIYLPQFVPIKDGAKNGSYDGDTITVGEHTIDMQSGWSPSNVPENATAIAIRLGWIGGTAGHWCALRARSSSQNALYIATQVNGQGVDIAGVVPLHQGNCCLEVGGGSGLVDLFLMGYWM